MKYDLIKRHIVEWLKKALIDSGAKGFVVGVSGGIDSALVSTLAASTDAPTLVLNMPINQEIKQYDQSNMQIYWLKERFSSNIESRVIDLTDVFETYEGVINPLHLEKLTDLAMANTASRFRMITLYTYANAKNYLVVGTGNKVEDYGVGFFTKYGDGGVDISPIADLLKSEVYDLAKYLEIPDSIQNAIPTDGLWNDNRSDEEQLGATYAELEWALKYYDENGYDYKGLSERQKKVLDIYHIRHNKNKHKLETPPVCMIPKGLK